MKTNNWSEAKRMAVENDKDINLYGLYKDINDMLYILLCRIKFTIVRTSWCVENEREWVYKGLRYASEWVSIKDVWCVYKDSVLSFVLYLINYTRTPSNFSTPSPTTFCSRFVLLFPDPHHLLYLIFNNINMVVFLWRKRYTHHYFI